MIRISDGGRAEFKSRGDRSKFAPDGHSILYIDKDGNIARKAFPSPENAGAMVVVPASPDMVIETFHPSPDGRHIVAAYQEATRSLMVAEGVAGVRLPGRTK